jgi:cytochrome P450
MKNPDAYEKLVAEIDEATRDGRLSTPHIKYTEATSLPYLVASCKEGMRLHPSVGLSLPRYVPEGGKIIAGRFFPAGTKVGVSAPVVHFNKSIFGQDAAVFNPDRWLYDSDAATTMDRHMFQFGAGSRTCIGKNVSLSPRGTMSMHLAD